MMSMMLDSTSLTQVDAFFDAVRAESGLIINAADARQGACYEWGSFGPSFHEESGSKTYYTLVAAPKALKIWLNLRDLQGWTEIDLKPLFK